VKPDQIRLIIGPGGKTIKGIIDQTGVAIDVEDDGTVNIASADSDAVKKALDIIKGLTTEPEVGATYKGTVSASPTSARSSSSCRAPTASCTSRRWRTPRRAK
jgi:polyribonucleotide nucleotidyltransferase